jgi:hypothetical protein
MTLDRKACERRVYRLAVLLTGHRATALRVMEAAVGAQPDLRRPDSARLDRLTILRCRETEPGVIVDPDVPPRLAQALGGLPVQLREAWVLHRFYQLPIRETSRAMDCSTTATTRHLEQADDALTAALGDKLAEATEMLLSWSMSLDVPAFYRARQRRREQFRRIAIAVALLALVAVILWLAGHVG